MTARRRRKHSIPRIKAVFTVANPDLLQSQNPTHVRCYFLNHGLEVGLLSKEYANEYNEAQCPQLRMGFLKIYRPRSMAKSIFLLLVPQV